MHRYLGGAFLLVLGWTGSGCWSVYQTSEMGPVRLVIYTSPLGICGSSDCQLESLEGRALVRHTPFFSYGYPRSQDGQWMLTVGWVERSDYRLYVLDLTTLKVVFTFDLPDEDGFSNLEPKVGPWSPDQTRIVLVRHPRARKDILEHVYEDAVYVVSIGPQGIRCEPLFREHHRKLHDIYGVRWSPDGSSLALLVALAEGDSDQEGWKLLQVTPGNPVQTRQVATSTRVRGIGWDAGQPYILKE